MSSCSVSYGACQLLDGSGHKNTRPIYRTVADWLAGRRFDMPDFVWTVDGDSSEPTSYRTGNWSMASV
ncbi:hypothetical protein KY284_026313 [Solanum tuberosum]|nr:hypothetical protein KY284_026313 [Solanum tuberosum]